MSSIQGAIKAATQCEVCGRLGHLELFHISGSGQGIRAAVPCIESTCAGRMWTIGRYGVPSLEGTLQTVLLHATPDELRILGELATRGREGELDTAAVVTALERTGTPGAQALAAWVKANESHFTAAGTLLALVALLCQLLTATGDDNTTNVNIDVDKIIVRDDGHVTLRDN